MEFPPRRLLFYMLLYDKINVFWWHFFLKNDKREGRLFGTAEYPDFRGQSTRFKHQNFNKAHRHFQKSKSFVLAYIDSKNKPNMSVTGANVKINFNQKNRIKLFSSYK